MGNKLTVANATDNDICVRASVEEGDLKGGKIGVDGIKLSGINIGLTFEEQMVQLGSVGVAPSKTWTFPKVVFGRYFLTVTKKGYSDVIANVAQIPWHTNIIVTPDNKPSRARSGTVWIDDADGTNYYAPKKTKGSQHHSAEQSPPLSSHDALDGVNEEPDEAEMDGGTATVAPLSSPEEAAARLQLSADVPKFISSFIISHCFEHGCSDVDEIDEHISVIMKALSSNMTSDHVERLKAARGDHIDEMLLDQLLKPLDLHPDVSQSVIGHLVAEEKRKEETAKLLRQLAVDAVAASSPQPPPPPPTSSPPPAAAEEEEEEKILPVPAASVDRVNDNSASESWMSRCDVL